MATKKYVGCFRLYENRVLPQLFLEAVLYNLPYEKDIEAHFSCLDEDEESRKEHRSLLTFEKEALFAAMS